MRLTARRRAVIAILVTWPFAFFLAGWIANVAFDFVLYLRGGYTRCGSGVLGLPERFTSCGYAYRPALAALELAGMLAVAIAGTYLLARWVVWPVQAMADTVERLGPNSLGMRLPADGPRDETRRLAEAVNAMLDRVAEGYEAQRRFAANASHELRTPLATQRALIEVSLQSALTTDQLALLSRQLLATNERNEALIEGLLVLAETERGLVSVGRQRLDLITAAVVETFRPEAKERGIEIDARLAPSEVVGEQPLLERLASNLVQNALKYNVPDGWIHVLVEAGTLIVTNTGPRVPAERVDSLFEPFRRASGDRLDHGGGVGLGLTIARSIVAAHHGTIRAHANPDGGLSVAVQLPRP